MADNSGDAASYGAETVRESLSQLVAKILDQLSISAWLPSAALTLLTAFVLQLGSAREASASHHDAQSVASVVNSALAGIGNTSIGGLLLLVAVIVVLTMVTQAFAFESIRFLEGYWGINRLSERVAQARARHWRRQRKRLLVRRATLRSHAWKRAERRLTADGTHSPAVVTALRAAVLETGEAVELTDADDDDFDSIQWEAFAPAEDLRRIVNLDARLADFPSSKASVMPTRLGNVLRHWEDQTGHPRVEQMVDEGFDKLDPALAASHDEQRGRLDLYCSMLFVMATVAVVAALRFIWLDWRYAVAVIGACVLASIVLYRAAVASARYYGALLLVVARRLEHVPTVGGESPKD